MIIDLIDQKGRAQWWAVDAGGNVTGASVNPWLWRGYRVVGTPSEGLPLAVMTPTSSGPVVMQFIVKGVRKC